MELCKNRTLEALNHLGVSEQKFQAGFTNAMKDPGFAKRVQIADIKLAQSYDTKDRGFTESKEEIKHFFLEKIKMESQLHLKLASTPMPPQ